MYTLKEALQNAGYEIGKKEINVYAITQPGLFTFDFLSEKVEVNNLDYVIVRLDENKSNLILSEDEQKHVLILRCGKMYNFLHPGEVVVFDCSLSGREDLSLVIRFINNCYNILDSVDVQLLVDPADVDFVKKSLINIDVIYHEV